MVEPVESRVKWMSEEKLPQLSHVGECALLIAER
jgi:hypothetical protein